MKKTNRVRRMNPLLGVMVAECETTSKRVRAKLRNAYGWCFCEICGQLTEYAVALEARKVFKKKTRNSAWPVPMSDAMRVDAQSVADRLVQRFKEALGGTYGPYEATQMIATYCDSREMQKAWYSRENHVIVDEFRDQVERRAQNAAWALRGDVLSAALLPNQKEGESKPSKFYCENHNPSRSDDARRAYQRDRRFAAEYEELMTLIWADQKLPTWDIEAHAYVRTEAYRLLHAMKSTKNLIAAELNKGVRNQSEIARNLGIENRQTVSIAIKRNKLLQDK
ncbi:hypothetical protein [Massilia sp. NR 4-1]|uniref:hypothetical protein n=1 Tax=Massilia sp. NR 4-1 TaxID=1678028 RepID=UPI0006A2F41A|nr:hypothetical protein [Massilia sp. NR 4-1]AKU20771.1 hypothetical protein ACZ75_03865 [Massilia sp. NR 4-1]